VVRGRISAWEVSMNDEARRDSLIERVDEVRERWRRLVADVGPA
jgi:hypothetical protein